MMVVPVVVLLVVVGLGSYLAALTAAQSWGLWARVAVLVIALAIVVRFTLAPLIRWRTTHFVITNRRVLVREGLVTRRGMDIPMRRITGVQFRQSLFERLFGVGTLVMESASDDPLEFHDVPGIEEVHGLLYQEVAKGA
jgi:uncharacterized membrane protein YdbT with pleckstrin-like domain